MSEPDTSLGDGISVRLEGDHVALFKWRGEKYIRITLPPEQCDNFTTWLREQRGTATDDD